MPTFNLSDVRVQRRVDADLAQAHAKSHEVLGRYEPMGYRVAVDVDEARQIKGRVSNSEGTQIEMQVNLSDDGQQTTVTIALSGVVFVGGMKGMLATDAKVKSVAKEQLSGLIDGVFRGVKRAGDPTAATDSTPEPEDGLKSEAGAQQASNESAATDNIPEGNFKAKVEDVRGRDFSSASDTEKNEKVQEVIQVAAIAAGAVTIQPLPILDSALITPIQITMVQVIGNIRGYNTDAKAILEMLGTFGASIVAQNLIIAGAKLVPIAGWAVSISLAYALTRAIGEASDLYFRSGRSVSPADMRRVFKATFDRAKEEKRREAETANEQTGLKGRLEQLSDAFDAGLLTEAEFMRKKEKIIGSLGDDA